MGRNHFSCHLRSLSGLSGGITAFIVLLVSSCMRPAAINQIVVVEKLTAGLDFTALF